MYSIDNLRFVMDETSAPYEENENPFVQTELDNEFEQMIINKYHLTTKEMEDHKSKEMLQQITNKLGFDIREYNTNDFGEAHERDNIPNPFDKLSLEELVFLRENNYFL